MEWRKAVADYLSFSRKDRIAIIVILVMIPLVFFLPVIIHNSTQHSILPPDSSWVISMKKLERKGIDILQNYQPDDEGNASNYQYDESTTNSGRETTRKLFFFDPNTLATEDWQRLGLKDRIIRTIQNYLRKGGTFKKPEDLKRIYGLFPDEFERLSPFIRIPSDGKLTKLQDAAIETGQPSPVKMYPVKFAVIDINKADSFVLIAFPGIGPKLAARIINFRDKLGGFYSVEQVAETFGLPDSTFRKIKPYIKVEDNAQKKININTITADELKSHPYFKWNMANAIIAYRNQHGIFESTADIRKVMLVTDDFYKKVSPYLYTQ